MSRRRKTQPVRSGQPLGPSTLPPADGNYVIYTGRYRNHNVWLPGRELCYSMPDPPLGPGQSKNDPAYLEVARQAGRTILKHTGQFMDEGFTPYAFGAEADPTRLTEDGDPWIECSLAPHLAEFERRNREAVRQNEEPLYEVHMVSEMKRAVIALLARKTKAEQEQDALMDQILSS